MKNFLVYLLFRVMGSTSFIRRLEWRRIMAWLAPREGERVLDIACGMGELSLLIAQKGAEVYGIDMSPEAIESARRLSKKAGIPCRYEVGDAQHLPYPDGYFDKVICSSSLEHFKDDTLALNEMRRVLKDNGRVVLTTDSFTLPISHELKERHRKMCLVVHYYTCELLEKSFHNCGLDMHRSEYIIKSSLASFFLKRWIKCRRPVIFWLLVSFLGYPFFLVAEKLSGGRKGGYTLIAEAGKAG